MIRQLAILAVAAICLASATPDVTDKEDVAKAQKVIFGLMTTRFEPDKVDPEIYRKGQEWDFETKLDSFEPEYQLVIKKFLARYKLGLLPRGRLFSIYYPAQLDETILVFKVFYHAPDIWTLIYTSIWASLHLNEYQFAYALSVAMVHRLDTKFIPTPHPYQIYPEYFFNSDVMKQVYDYKISLHKIGDKIEHNHTHVIEAKYTNWYVTETLEHEYSLAFFLEDVGLNTFYYYFNLRYPFWMSSQEYPDLPLGERGELYYYAHKTFLTIFNMERLSHGLTDVELLNWDKPIPTGFSPYMTYPNGMQFPHRNEMSSVPASKNEYLEKIKEFESRITEAIDSGYIFTTNGTWESIRNPKGLNIIGNIIQGNTESLNKNYYGSIDILGRHILGFSPESQNIHQILPSALEQTSTSMRDPGFYRLYHKIDSFISGENLGVYTPEELAFEGVTIKSGNIVEGDIITYLEMVDTLIDKFRHFNNEKVTNIKTRQHRLNHKPYTYNISINSVEDVKASIRICLGPKYDVYGKEISDNYKNFYELDYFVKDLKKGLNVIERKSTDSPWFSVDHKETETFDKIAEGVEQLIFDRERFGFPDRLIIPKGKVDGLPAQFLFYVNEFKRDPSHRLEPLLGARDNKPIGFPLDRPIHNFNMPNMYLLDTQIFHKKEAVINLTIPSHKLEPLLEARDKRPIIGFPLHRSMYNFSMPKMYHWDTNTFHKRRGQINLGNQWAGI